MFGVEGFFKPCLWCSLNLSIYIVGFGIKAAVGGFQFEVRYVM